MDRSKRKWIGGLELKMETFGMLHQYYLAGIANETFSEENRVSPSEGGMPMLRGALEFRQSEPEYQCHPREVIAEGDRVVMTWDVKMSKAQLEVLGVFRIHSGKIVELQEYFTGDGYRLFAESEPPVEKRE